MSCGIVAWVRWYSIQITWKIYVVNQTEVTKKERKFAFILDVFTLHKSTEKEVKNENLSCEKQLDQILMHTVHIRDTCCYLHTLR